MSHTFALECLEGSRTAGQIVSHFYKFENEVCTCVFCGDKKEIDYFNMTINQYNNFDPFQTIVGQRN